MYMLDKPDIYEDIKRGMLTALGLAVPAYPAYMLVDWFVRPDRFAIAAAFRLVIALYSLACFIFFRRVSARHSIPLLYLTVILISLCQIAITLTVGEITYLLASAIILFVIASLIPTRLRDAIALNLIMFCAIFLVPYLFLGMSPSNQVMGIYGLITGLAAASLSVIISVRMFRMKELQIASYKELQTKNEELADLADRNKKQAETAISALGEIAEAIKSLADAILRVQQESSQLSASAEEMRAGILEMAGATERIYASIGEIDARLQKSKQAVVAFGQYEKGEATDKRRKLIEVAYDMADNVSEIGKISDVVTGMARKTHILALNAGIETATKGSSGSFSIIAGRMREFSEEVRSKTREIVSLVKSLENTAQILSHLLVDYDSRASMAVNNFAVTVEEIDAVADNMATIIQKAESIASASREQIAAISNLAVSAARLDDLVGDLQSLMSHITDAEEKIRKIV